MKDIQEKDLIARADAQAWNDETDEQLSIERVETNLKDELGAYDITFYTQDGLSITKHIRVIDQMVFKNDKKTKPFPHSTSLKQRTKSRNLSHWIRI